MEVLLGITGKDFTIVAASKAAMRGATILKAADDKTRNLNDHTLMAYSGEAGDTVQFAEYIQANIALYTTRNSYSLPTSSIASFTRGELARALRSRKPYQVNLLLGGVELPTASATDPKPSDSSTATIDPSDKEAAAAADAPVRPRLYWLDYLASLAEVPYAAHGYAQYYCLSILDKHHHPGIDLEQGMRLLRMCSEELRRRLPIDFKGLTVKVVTREGTREMQLDDNASIKAP